MLLKLESVLLKQDGTTFREGKNSAGRRNKCAVGDEKGWRKEKMRINVRVTLWFCKVRSAVCCQADLLCSGHLFQRIPRQSNVLFHSLINCNFQHSDFGLLLSFSIILLFTQHISRSLDGSNVIFLFVLIQSSVFCTFSNND